ncbi:zinc finger protein 787-like [Solenopsis invicta]|uniref:zinc finger protein 787-like n=1 Tax=Solenopsis invicta TaxID=13686 RepID=UPI00193E5749|nr:zinc finger protein 787-like [Solenopsis invicta]
MIYFDCDIAYWYFFVTGIPLLTMRLRSETLVESPIERPSMKSWSCYRCSKRYVWRDSLAKHLRVECGKDPTFECPICGRKFKHKHRWQSHARLIHHIYETTTEIQTSNKD